MKADSRRARPHFFVQTSSSRGAHTRRGRATCPGEKELLVCRTSKDKRCTAHLEGEGLAHFTADIGLDKKKGCRSERSKKKRGACLAREKNMRTNKGGSFLTGNQRKNRQEKKKALKRENRPPNNAILSPRTVPQKKKKTPLPKNPKNDLLCSGFLWGGGQGGVPIWRGESR